MNEETANTFEMDKWQSCEFSSSDNNDDKKRWFYVSQVCRGLGLAQENFGRTAANIPGTFIFPSLGSGR